MFLHTLTHLLLVTTWRGPILTQGRSEEGKRGSAEHTKQRNIIKGTCPGQEKLAALFHLPYFAQTGTSDKSILEPRRRLYGIVDGALLVSILDNFSEGSLARLLPPRGNARYLLALCPVPHAPDASEPPSEDVQGQQATIVGSW